MNIHEIKLWFVLILYSRKLWQILNLAIVRTLTQCDSA